MAIGNELEFAFGRAPGYFIAEGDSRSISIVVTRVFGLVSLDVASPRNAGSRGWNKVSDSGKRQARIP